MDDIDIALTLREALELARAEEAEALRRANNLRVRGGSSEDIRAAVCEAQARRSTVARLVLELRGRMQ
ncbi:hypothetical protein [Ramlibacter tataouinensis]|uniref:Uncharacterized protein n=1 Tax=Ramlibacter tataouinensis (strain ATCC BAA-407 / DSM 14655 / LMG 21543 / TTB310) TaxID=365046 RepID=F5XZU7_RAMTT|nr:hypothetical protein [Ramlibacter tataouinensis]AEG93308.1 Hypothetical protein Rta_22120 [Ramlibacter tataouinensis TTB310]